MTDKGATYIAIAVIACAAAYAVGNRYSVVPSNGSTAAIMTKDNWSGVVELCTPQKCFRP